MGEKLSWGHLKVSEDDVEYFRAFGATTLERMLSEVVFAFSGFPLFVLLKLL